MSNPVFREGVFEKSVDTTSQPMTVNGAISKTLILSVILILSAFVTVSVLSGVNPVYEEVYGNEYVASGMSTISYPVLVAVSIATLILALIISFKPTTAPYLSVVYAVVEGGFLGIISAMFAYQFDGIVGMALASTIVVLFVMLALYRFRIINPTAKFKSIVVSATMGIAVFYIIMLVLSIFNITPSWFYGSGPVSIGISAVVIVIAALNLILDFDFIEQGANQGLPSYMEWYAAFGLMVTIIWLYLEILRLLAKAKSND